MKQIKAFECEHCGKIFKSKAHKCYLDPANRACITCFNYRTFTLSGKTKSTQWCDTGIKKGVKGLIDKDNSCSLPFVDCYWHKRALSRYEHHYSFSHDRSNKEYVPGAVLKEYDPAPTVIYMPDDDDFFN